MMLAPVAVAWAVASSAQTVPSPFPGDNAVLFRDDVAGVRRPEDADREGFALGTLRLTGGAGVTSGYDGNVLNLSANGANDLGTDIEPSVALDSRWNRHAVSLQATGRLRRFASLTSENSDSWRLAATGRIDVGSAGAIYPDLDIGQLVEPRGSGGPVFPGTFPSTYGAAHAIVGIVENLRPFKINLVGGYTERHYDPLRSLTGGSSDQSYRNVGIWAGGAQVDYEVSPALSVFVHGLASVNQSLRDLGIQTRDANGYLVTAGVNAEITPLVIARVSGGWTKQTYASPLFLPFDGPTFNIIVDWYPTPLLSFRVSSLQEFDNSGIPGVPGILAINSYLRAYYEVRRDVLVTLDIEEQHQRFRELNITTETVSATVRITHRLNQYLSLGLIGRVRGRGTSDATQISGYSGSFAGVTIEGRL